MIAGIFLYDTGSSGEFNRTIGNCTGTVLACHGHLGICFNNQSLKASASHVLDLTCKQPWKMYCMTITGATGTYAGSFGCKTIRLHKTAVAYASVKQHTQSQPTLVDKGMTQHTVEKGRLTPQRMSVNFSIIHLHTPCLQAAANNSRGLLVSQVTDILGRAGQGNRSARGIQFLLQAGELARGVEKHMFLEKGDYTVAAHAIWLTWTCGMCAWK